MLIIGFGVTEVLLSTLVFTCETCGNHAAHQLTKQNRKFSLFFIPLFSVGTKYFKPAGPRRTHILPEGPTSKPTTRGWVNFA
jgi:hypothetical protein